MHELALDFARRALNYITPRPRSVLEFGSRDINGTARVLFPPGTLYVGIDQQSGSGVDIIADAASYVPLTTFPDLIICMEVLEHTRDANKIVQNAGAILRQGGHLLMTCATSPRKPHSAIGEGKPREGEFYRNVKPSWFKKWLVQGRLKNVWLEVDEICGDLYCLARKE